ncbi:formylglycine-generating enzyme family protein [Phenylobacterium deserti]|uniref:Formylglycine-generating enzyme family protein n=2 Tax=Phenylobacterium deserti TaxID=1914756 RepID=A0A328AA38_9CAUL|nr:formylglycine-generating enzyme family protein [Phenylobacterium deserti]
MVFIAGRRFTMGSERFYPEEAPLRPVEVDSFWIDETPVTNAQFAAFVAATGYVTEAEEPPLFAEQPDLVVAPGALVFGPREDGEGWWSFVAGANWRSPAGPGSSIGGLESHPVAQVSFRDAQAYAAWAGKALPSEAEWELAARGGLDDADFAWGDELAPGGAMMANYWQGAFPHENLALDGFERTSPVRSFPANGHGLFDMIGNVWEWTADDYAEDLPTRPCCGSRVSAGPRTLVLKGGSHLCAENYCQRYRPAARIPQSADSATSHIGFRCVVRPV